jgi:hypothetical protein
VACFKFANGVIRQVPDLIWSKGLARESASLNKAGGSMLHGYMQKVPRGDDRALPRIMARFDDPKYWLALPG